MRCAVVVDGVVVNIIMARPTDPAPEDGELIAVRDMDCAIGSAWNGTRFEPVE